MPALDQRAGAPNRLLPMRELALASVLATVAGGGSAAGPPAVSGAAPSDPCSQATTTLDMAECSAAQAKHWDSRLNTAYQKLTRQVEPSQRTPLVDAQRLWIRYRNSNCGFYAAASGSIGRVAAADCVQSMTKQRACELESAAGPEVAAATDCR